MQIFFTSDTHFNHVIVYESYCPERKKRFSSLDEMNEVLIENWNNVVQSDDLVYHLGDFAMGDRGKFEAFRKSLKGKIILIGGNHDLERGKKKAMFELFGSDNVHRRLTLDLPGLGRTQLIHSPTIWEQQVVKRDQGAPSLKDHKCTFSYDNRDADGWLLCSCGSKRRRTERTLEEGVDVGLCGHVHQHWRVSNQGRWINVGVDVWDFKPVNLNELILLKKPISNEIWTQ